jgi:hypothetical protein
LPKERHFPLCYLGCLLFGSERFTEANQGNEEEILKSKNFVPLETRHFQPVKKGKDTCTRDALGKSMGDLLI